MSTSFTYARVSTYKYHQLDPKSIKFTNIPYRSLEPEKAANGAGSESDNGEDDADDGDVDVDVVGIKNSSGSYLQTSSHILRVSLLMASWRFNGEQVPSRREANIYSKS